MGFFKLVSRKNDANNTTPYPTPCHVRHSQNFDKIDSFLKPVLNIFTVGNIFVEWGEGVIKEKASIPHHM